MDIFYNNLMVYDHQDGIDQIIEKNQILVEDHIIVEQMIE